MGEWVSGCESGWVSDWVDEWVYNWTLPVSPPPFFLKKNRRGLVLEGFLEWLHCLLLKWLLCFLVFRFCVFFFFFFFGCGVFFFFVGVFWGGGGGVCDAPPFPFSPSFSGTFSFFSCPPLPFLPFLSLPPLPPSPSLPPIPLPPSLPSLSFPPSKLTFTYTTSILCIAPPLSTFLLSRFVFFSFLFSRPATFASGATSVPTAKLLRSSLKDSHLLPFFERRSLLSGWDPHTHTHTRIYILLSMT